MITWRWLFKWKRVSPFTFIVRIIAFGVASAPSVQMSNPYYWLEFKYDPYPPHPCPHQKNQKKEKLVRRHINQSMQSRFSMLQTCIDDFFSTTNVGVGIQTSNLKGRSICLNR